MHQIKIADLLWITAECIVAISKKAGKDVKITDVYNSETAKSLAFVAGFNGKFLRELYPDEFDVVE